MQDTKQSKSEKKNDDNDSEVSKTVYVFNVIIILTVI